MRVKHSRSSLPRNLRGAHKMFFVYILKSFKDGQYYIGCTSNLQKRLQEHNAGKTLSLKNRRPLEIIYFEEYDNQTEAYLREKQIKLYKGGVSFKKLIQGEVA